MSWRQYSFGPAIAGVVIATKASANNAEAGATVNFKSCFMLSFLCWLQPPQPTCDVGDAGAIRGEK
jgi:hypothetical protein